MVVFVEYTTREGDRWDLIALRMYGDGDAYEPIVAANPHVPIRPVLVGGLRLLVPVMDQPKLSDPNVPPWKRSTP